MTAQETREALQNESARLLSDWTRQDLKHYLKRTREQSGGLSLMEIAEVIKEVFTKEEAEAISAAINIKTI